MIFQISTIFSSTTNARTNILNTIWHEQNIASFSIIYITLWQGSTDTLSMKISDQQHFESSGGHYFLDHFN